MNNLYYLNRLLQWLKLSIVTLEAPEKADNIFVP